MGLLSKSLSRKFPGSDFSFPNNAVRLAGDPDPINRNSSCKTVNFIVFSSKLLTAFFLKEEFLKEKGDSLVFK